METYDKEEEEEKFEEEALSPRNTTVPMETEISPQQTSLSLGNTEDEVAATLATLGTPMKSKKKRSRQTHLYFKTRKSTRIRQSKPETPTKVPIIIEGSPSKKEEVGKSTRIRHKIMLP